MKLFASSRLQEPDKHKYIELVEFALHNDKFSAEEASKACGLSEKEFRFVSASIFSLSGYQAQAGFDPASKLDWILKPETYFSYLQYLEFRHAIETAKRAYWLSVAAIIIAILSTVPAILK
jgi:hypothetical protein